MTHKYKDRKKHINNVDKQVNRANDQMNKKTSRSDQLPALVI